MFHREMCFDKSCAAEIFSASLRSTANNGCVLATEIGLRKNSRKILQKRDGLSRWGMCRHFALRCVSPLMVGLFFHPAHTILCAACHGSLRVRLFIPGAPYIYDTGVRCSA